MARPRRNGIVLRDAGPRIPAAPERLHEMFLLQTNRGIVRTLKDAQDEFAATLHPDEDLIWDRGWIETADWWIIFYNTRKYYETQNPLFGLAGNSPFVAPKDGGATFHLRTNTTIESQLNEHGQRILAES